VAAACVDAMSACIGDPASTYADGVVSAVNQTARRAGVAVGQPAVEAARRMLRRED
jgi:nucleotidyltransferase/DNA polymerase involved in DNA repair